MVQKASHGELQKELIGALQDELTAYNLLLQLAREQHKVLGVNEINRLPGILKKKASLARKIDTIENKIRPMQGKGIDGRGAGEFEGGLKETLKKIKKIIEETLLHEEESLGHLSDTQRTIRERLVRVQKGLQSIRDYKVKRHNHTIPRFVDVRR
ncbi:MAG: flagellar export chaperone FlgN [Pseudomonadota bacterium]